MENIPKYLRELLEKPGGETFGTITMVDYWETDKWGRRGAVVDCDPPLKDKNGFPHGRVLILEFYKQDVRETMTNLFGGPYQGSEGWECNLLSEISLTVPKINWVSLNDIPEFQDYEVVKGLPHE